MDKKCVLQDLAVNAKTAEKVLNSSVPKLFGAFVHGKVCLGNPCSTQKHIVFILYNERKTADSGKKIRFLFFKNREKLFR